ncbi:hypothetical protein LSH36_1121g00020 [Paralvinella palmiformis]|uniref:Uncharacterized protein n=1 Tax=Paralvinella palmiformis TaxID=53620 RepID=A0AAD9IW17_9ANNE|nr:hypothetical protein LSH36_1121g00020 [Paralvinella palmiformis]
MRTKAPRSNRIPRSLWLRKYSDNVKQQREDAVMSLKLRLVEEESLVIREQQELLARERKQIREDEERRRMLFLDQAKQIAESKQSLVKSKSRAAPGESRQEDDDDEEEEHLISATKRVTLVEPELTADLYTIDEKDSISGGLAETNDDDAD